MQPAMRLFLLFHSIGIPTSIPATIYKVFLPLPTNQLGQYLPLLFWVFALNSNYNLSIEPFFVLFLTVERLLILLSPIKFRDHRRSYLFVVSFLALLFYSVSLAFFLAELPLDPKISLNSPPLIRIAPKYNFVPQSVFQTTFGVCNLVCILLFLFLIRKREMSNKIKYRVIKFTVICELCFNQITSLSNLLSNFLTGRILSIYLGGIMNAMMNLDTAVCAIFFTWIYLFEALREVREKAIKSRSMFVRARL